MVKSLIKYGLIAIVAIVIYNYFAGTPEEKAQSKKIFSEVGAVAKSVRGLVIDEKGKFDKGKYDTAIDQVSGALQKLKTEAKSSGDTQALTEIERLEDKAQGLKTDAGNQTDLPAKAPKSEIERRLEQAQQLKKGLDDLSSMVEALSGKMESKQ